MNNYYYVLCIKKLDVIKVNTAITRNTGLTGVVDIPKHGSLSVAS